MTSGELAHISALAHHRDLLRAASARTPASPPAPPVEVVQPDVTPSERRRRSAAASGGRG